MVVRMRVIKVPGVLGRLLAGILGAFGWRPSPPR